MTEPRFENNKPTDIDCPECKDAGRGSVKLIVKTNRQNGGQFLGCPRWPECQHTRAIPEAWIMRANGQPELL